MLHPSEGYLPDSSCYSNNHTPVICATEGPSTFLLLLLINQGAFQRGEGPGETTGSLQEEEEERDQALQGPPRHGGPEEGREEAWETWSDNGSRLANAVPVNQF